MALTRSELAAFNEAELRLRVLIPLFKAMDFRDVHHYHGGSQEHGKDIVMWESDRLRERVNYAVVAKATTISGQASGTSSAAEVRFQTEQCFNIPYADPVTTEEQRVHRCLVVTSKEIRKEAINAVKDILKQQHLDIATEFIDGHKLWELIEQYMPSWTVLEKVQQAQAVFEEVSPNDRITIATKGGIPVYSFEEKHPAASEVEPLDISVRCQFPQTPEGQQQFQAMEEHIKTGVPVTLEDSYIQEFKLPAFLRTVFDPEQLAKGVLSINPQRSLRPILVRVAVENDGGRVAFDYIELYVTQAGMEEVTFDNIEQPIPWKITLVLNLKEQRMHFRYHMNAAGVNVQQVLEGFRFQEAMAKGGMLRIEDLETGFDIQQTTISPGTFQCPAFGWFQLTQQLVFIQTTARVPLRMPSERPTLDEFEFISILVQKLRAGEVAVKDITFDLDTESARGAIERFRDGHLLEAAPLEETVEICGATILMGPVTAHCERACLAEEELDALNTAIANTETGGTVRLRLVPCQGYAMSARYKKWLPEIRS